MFDKIIQGIVPSVALALSVTSPLAAVANIPVMLHATNMSTQSSVVVVQGKPIDQIAHAINKNQMKIALKKRMETLLPVPRPVKKAPEFVAVKPVIAAPAVKKTIVDTPVAVLSGEKSISDEQLEYLGHCESGMTAARNSGNGYYGAFQFSYGTWKSMNTGYERADMAPLDVQKDAVQRLLKRSSIYTQFPGCSRKMHAAGLI